MTRTITLRGCDFPDDRYYHANFNVWVQRTGEDVVTLGATSYGAALAIEFFAFTPKPVGMAIEPGRAVGLLELSKTVVSVRTPIAGRLMQANPAAMARPAIIGNDPYGEGWLVRLATPANLADETHLLQGEALIAPFEAEMMLENFEGPRTA